MGEARSVSPAMMALVNFPNLSCEPSRHGQVRYYARVGNRRKRVRGVPGTAAFQQAYDDALAALRGFAAATAAEGTFRWLGEAYERSMAFRALDIRSQRTRRAILKSCFAEPYTPGSDRLFGDYPFAALTVEHIAVLRDRKAELPGAANNRLKYLSSLFAWAIEARILSSNPAREVKRIKYASEGFAPWTKADVAKFVERWPPGSKPFLALALFLMTGARRGDVVELGRQHVRDHELRFVPNKTRYRRATAIVLPYPPELAAIVAASPCGELTFLVTEHGKGFTANGFGGWWRDKCDRAGLHHLAAHGLRKIGASIAADEGATDEMLQAFFGWSTPGQSKTYTGAADRARLARAAGAKIASVVAPLLAVQGSATNVSDISLKRKRKL